MGRAAECGDVGLRGANENDVSAILAARTRVDAEPPLDEAHTALAKSGALVSPPQSPGLGAAEETSPRADDGTTLSPDDGVIDDSCEPATQQSDPAAPVARALDAKVVEDAEFDSPPDGARLLLTSMPMIAPSVPPPHDGELAAAAAWMAAPSSGVATAAHDDTGSPRIPRGRRLTRRLSINQVRTGVSSIDRGQERERRRARPYHEAWFESSPLSYRTLSSCDPSSRQSRFSLSSPGRPLRDAARREAHARRRPRRGRRGARDPGH